MLQLELLDGKVLEVEEGKHGYEVIGEISKSLLKDSIAYL